MSQIPVTVIGGYLGAGKTTLVNHMLRNAAGRKIAILVNEFGELSIDEDLIEAEDDGLISIAGGCICCTFGNDLIGALQDLATMSPPPDHIVIESSGVAIPGAIVSTMMLSDAFRSDGIVVVADAETVQRNANDDYIGDTITRQLADAEIVILNKTDLISSSDLTALETWVTRTAPRAITINATRGAVPPDALLGIVKNPGPGHKQSHSDGLFDSMILQPAPDTSPSQLANRLATGSFGVIRAKGYMHDSDGTLWLLHTVGQRWDAEPATGEHATGIICLGYRDKLDKEAIFGNFESHTEQTTETLADEIM